MAKMDNLVDFAHSLWKTHLKKGDLALDTTCGNGHDTLFLAKLVADGSKVTAIDIQKQAIIQAKKKTKEEGFDNVCFYHQSHTLLPKGPFKLICYNLGYLPNSDKSILTKAKTTIASLKCALEVLDDQGLISILCYQGHLEGKKEVRAVVRFAKELSSETYQVSMHTRLNAKDGPVLVVIKKR
jgi:methylase of polypeptide subunit release factors